MTLPPLRPVLISAAVFCSAFVVTCRAQTILPCPDPVKILHRTVEQEDRVCISRKPLPACPPLCRAAESTEKNLPFRCYRKGVPPDSPGEDALLSVTIPVSCELPLPFTGPQPDSIPDH